MRMLPHRPRPSQSLSQSLSQSRAARRRRRALARALARATPRRLRPPAPTSHSPSAYRSPPCHHRSSMGPKRRQPSGRSIERFVRARRAARPARGRSPRLSSAHAMPSPCLLAAPALPQLSLSSGPCLAHWHTLIGTRATCAACRDGLSSQPLSSSASISHVTCAACACVPLRCSLRARHSGPPLVARSASFDVAELTRMTTEGRFLQASRRPPSRRRASPTHPPTPACLTHSPTYARVPHPPTHRPALLCN